MGTFIPQFGYEFYKSAAVTMYRRTTTMEMDLTKVSLKGVTLRIVDEELVSAEGQLPRIPSIWYVLHDRVRDESGEEE